MSFFSRNKEKIIVTIIAVGLILLIGFTSAERILLTRFEKTLGNVLSPIGKFTNSIGKNTSDFFRNVGEIGLLREENERLKTIISQLEEENRNYQNIIGKIDYLKNEAELKKNTKYDLIEAQITGKEPGNWYHRFTVDKGIKDGVKKGDTVIQGIQIDQNTIIEGIVGRVQDVGDNWSKIVTIVDENSSISFKLLRTQDGGIFTGNIDRKIRGYLFDDKADVIKGDKLFTAGLGGAYLKDIYVGEIESVLSDEEDLMKTIEIKAAVDFKKLHKVFIISE
ncbi:MAG: rod shape-determining protein MreC [Tissierellaceae bacterium]